MTLSLYDIKREIKRRHLEDWYILDCISNYKDAFIIYGPASVSVTDREGHKITVPALQMAVEKFMENPKYRDLNIFHCLFGSTEIRTKHGILPIKDIIIGDEVLTHRNRFKKVIKTFKHHIDGTILELNLNNNQLLNITDAHPLLVNSGMWVAAGKLKKGETLASCKEHSFGVIVENIKNVHYTGDIYNVEVATDNSYCGKDIVFHNSDVQIGEILPQWVHPETGKVFKTEVNSKGWWVVAKIRGDLEIAKKVREEVEKGNLRSFSIAGTAKDKTHNYDSINPHEDINDLEIYECTICCAPETKIMTACGLVDIASVTIGTAVLTHNKRYMPVSKTFKRYINEQLFTIKTASDKIIRVTAEHPILTKNRGWVAAKNIIVGDDL